jgi:hypothetical protein
MLHKLLDSMYICDVLQLIQQLSLKTLANNGVLKSYIKSLFGNRASLSKFQMGNKVPSELANPRLIFTINDAIRRQTGRVGL